MTVVLKTCLHCKEEFEDKPRLVQLDYCPACVDLALSRLAPNDYKLNNKWEYFIYEDEGE
jgi:hypothetical protein